jgi:hypothetical protein
VVRIHVPEHKIKNVAKNRDIIIAPRFCGPSDSGNGGYTCGLTAQDISGPAQVRLHLPPPLNTPLKLFHPEGGTAQLLWGERLVAEAKPTQVDITLPHPPSFQEAQTASKNYLGFHDHHYPECFVCGPKRKAKDGLRIFPGKIPGKKMVAAPWIPDDSLGDGKNEVRPEFIWAALDCPGAFAAMEDHFPPLLLGTLSAHLIKKIPVGMRMISVGWPIATEGRKLLVGTALFSEKGELFAKAKGIWILLKPD